MLESLPPQIRDINDHSSKFIKKKLWMTNAFLYYILLQCSTHIEKLGTNRSIQHQIEGLTECVPKNSKIGEDNEVVI